jgi:signal transduction histidine kinase
VTVRGEVKLAEGEAAPIAPPARSSTAFGSFRLLQVLILGLTVAGVVIGLRIAVPGGIAPVDSVAFGLTIVWALLGFVDTHARDRTGSKVSPFHLLAGVNALVAAIALAAGRQAETVHASSSARDVATVAAVVVTGISFHFLLALADGRLHDSFRRCVAVIAYIAALGVATGLIATHRPFTVVDSAISWAVAAALALAPIRARYLTSIGYHRERMEWFGIGVTLAATVALVATVLHLLVGWPGPLGAVAAGATVLVPLGFLAAESRRLGPHASRGLVQVLSVFGFVVVVSAIYLVVVLGVGHAPKTTGDKEALALALVASGVGALIYVPVRTRFLDSATRLVYGSREAPDEVLRTFGSRLTRAIPMDELLLQLAESLRKTMALTSAEVYTGTGEVLERTASVPDLGPRSLVVSPRERPVVTRAGVSGTAWASVWLPSLLEGRENEQVRVAPISHAGDLLGLIVVERSPMGSSFSEDDDRVLADLARQVGLALHNSQLDTALQTTLDEVRKQADALRESRARIVASGDAERRRVERNLHDGAQQHLVALAVNLRLARDIIVDDQAAGLEMLDALAGEVQETIQELRELAHGIYPPLLVDSGLIEALRAAAHRNPLPVDVEADGIGRYGSETEAAIYFCCLEALQNAAKHAPDASVEVRLWEESGGLLFTVTDDGPGFDPAKAQRGHGYVNMADRLGAIGGTVRWDSEIGTGSQVRGSVPLV